MKPSLLPVLLCLLTCISFSQERKYERINGKIKLESGTYCLYKEVPIENMNHGSRKKEFTDMFENGMFNEEGAGRRIKKWEYRDINHFKYFC